MSTTCRKSSPRSVSNKARPPKNFSRRKFAFPIFLAVSIGMFNQLSGINAILYYLNDIFGHAGFSKVSGNLQAVAIGATNLLFTMIAMSVIDKLGRKTLLLVGSVGPRSAWPGFRSFSSPASTRTFWSGCWWDTSHFSHFPRAPSSGFTSPKFSRTRCGPRGKAWAVFLTGS